MKIVIDISEAEYHLIKKLVASGGGNRQAILILGGTVLPKGHGDLIDRDNIETYITKEFKGKLTENEADLFVQFTNVTDEIPAVIDADMENDDDL